MPDVLISAPGFAPKTLAIAPGTCWPECEQPDGPVLPVESVPITPQ